MEALLIARTLLSTLNLGLLALLLWLFGNQYRKLRSQFTLGLLLVMLALLFHTLVMSPLFHGLLGVEHLKGTYGLLTLAADIFEAVALAVLVYLSWK